jgi:hypothetical protein
MNADKLSIEIAEICSEMLICDKIGWRVVVFVVKKNRERRRNERGREENRLLGHKLNIIDRFTNEFNHHI